MSFDEALESHVLLKDLLKNDDHERQFRLALRNKEERLLGYLSHHAILEDMIKAIIDEEDRSLQEASEVLGVLLANLEVVTNTFVQNHLGLFFSYLGRDVMNPRRLYYFLRVASFLLQTRTFELFAYVNGDPEFTPRLVKHLSSVHIMQLVLTMLKLEEQMIERGELQCEWSTKCNLIGNMVSSLQASPSTNLESVNKLLSEICNSYSINSEFIKTILLADEGSLIKTLVGLTKSRNVSAEAVKLLDEVIFKIIMANQSDEVFFGSVSAHFKQEKDVFSGMLKSTSLTEVLVGVKFMYTLIKHKAVFLLDDGLTTIVELFFRFPWANVLHNVVMEILIHIFEYEVEELIKTLLSSNLIRNIVVGLTVDQQVGYLPHLRQIMTAISTSPSISVQEHLSNEPLWEHYTEAMEYRSDKNLTFREAERRVVAHLKGVLEGNAEKSPENPADEQTTEEQTTTEEPVEDKPTEDNPTEEQITTEEPVEDKPTEDNPTEEQATTEELVEDKPTEDNPTEELTTPENPSDEQTTTEKPTEEKPTEGKPTEEKPAEEQPTEEKPTEGKPTEEKPAEEQPTEELPAEGKPTEEKPAEQLTETLGEQLSEEAPTGDTEANLTTQ